MRIVIAGGGTGGHLYPGIAVAQELMHRDPHTTVTFIGSKDGLVREILAREGFAFREITASGLQRRKLRDQVLSLAQLPKGLFESVRVLRQVQPDVVLGVGSYAAGPVVLAACALRIPRVIQEQNVLPGLTNRLLGRVADRVAVSFDESLPYFRQGTAVVTGNPVRPAIWESRAIAREPNGRFHLLIFGGSQGSHRLNVAMVDALSPLASVKDELRVEHQTGQKDYDFVRGAYAETVFPGMVRSYIQDMAASYGAADVVICRAGASTVAELVACGKPAILVPFPYAANNHQAHNARALEAAGAAVIVRDRDLTGSLLAERIRFYLSHAERVAEMAERSRALGTPGAAARVAELCLEVARTY